MNVIIFGTEDVSLLAKFYLEKDSVHKPKAFCVDASFLKDSYIEGIPVIAFEEVENCFSNENHNFFCPLYDNKLRELKSKQIKDKNYNLISYVSSKATLWSSVGENCFIMEDNTIQPYVSIGNNIIMWSGNHIGHHSVIKDNVFFSSHVVLSGHCNVESYSWFGVNCTIRDHVDIAEGSFIAMSSMVTKKTKAYKKYMGVPAREYGDVAQ